MLVNNLISITITLIIALLIYIYLGKRTQKGASAVLLSVFILGFAGILFNVIFFYLSSLGGLFPLGNSIKRVAFYALITAGFSRELGKFLALRFSVMARKLLNNPADGIVFSIMAALGFTFAALVWNVIFPVDEISEYYRSLLTLPANLITAVILGFFVGLGQLRKNIFIDGMTGLLAASVFHAVFEFGLLTNDPGLLAVAFAGSIIIVAVLIHKAIKLSISN